MSFQVEVEEVNGDNYFWYADTLEEASSILKLYYPDEDHLKEIEKILIFPLTNED